MIQADENTTVVIVGGGVAGLALGNFLVRSGISCIVLEKHSREYVEQRQRAGALDAGGVRMLHEWGMGEVVEGHSLGTSDSGMPMLVDGEKRYWKADEDDADDFDGAYCPQQVLVRNLIKVFLRDGGDLRFEAEDVSLECLDTERPLVRYRDAAGSTKVLGCDFVAGSDGYHGVSRTAIPADVLTCYTHEFGYAWLTVMTEVPADPLAVLAVHSRGFAAQITRGPNASRLYLQCPVTDTIEQWPDERVWNELEARFGAPVAAKGPITSKQVVPLRGVVFSPMSHGRLYLLGDAAHLISPMSAEGMSLALHDAEVFARAVIHHAQNDDSCLLDSYSDTCLSHTWERQASAVWMTDTMHDSGDTSYTGEFRKRIARVNLETLLEPPAANRLSE
ncbi:4-hydroxybenzoate 3-monooxygenase [Acrocarpospora pleiomorpha]|uniref:4-hydroxybenzoate 3-monooxygenase n=1 Tax=Acrocarpospora pleiomorpha TaxID=90975 RepID=A0A5M3XD23_9ACTN|nr:4-hydroxybenzoate 3-monooxygenase [Acrocarpospora pleiomorpha]GES18556.1 4-hydroxybenzoate 3-monooxygenase [Acrocarpospora pleiomorpha]